MNYKQLQIDILEAIINNRGSDTFVSLEKLNNTYDGYLNVLSAINDLDNNGYIKYVTGNGYQANLYIYTQGHDYLNSLKHPIKHWLKHNWFPLAVASASVITPIAIAIITL